MKARFLLLTLLLLPHSLFGQWKQTAGPYGANIRPLYTSGSLIFAGSIDGGAYESLDSGSHWKSITGNLQDNAVTAFTVIGSVTFAGTYNGGIFRSSDTGKSWVPIRTSETGKCITAFATFDNIVFVGTGIADPKGIFCSTDFGLTWKSCDTGTAMDNTTALAIVDSVIFVGTANNGVIRSTDKGLSWEEANKGIVLKDISRLGVKDKIIFASATGPGERSNYRSTDYGNHWFEVNTGIENYYVTCFASFGSDILAGTQQGGIFRSTDNGDHWNLFGTGLVKKQIYSVSSLGGKVFAGISSSDSSGVLRSTDNGLTWVTTNEGMTGLIIKCINGIGDKIFVGTPVGLFSSSNSGALWQRSDSGISLPSTIVISSHGSILDIGTESPGAYRSFDSGRTWLSLNIPGGPVTSFVWTDTALFMGTQGYGVYFSFDSGAHLVSFNTFLTSRSINALAAIGRTVFAATTSETYPSPFNGATWSYWDDTPTSLYHVGISFLATSGSKIFAAGGKVYLSSDTGHTWNPTSDDITGYIQAMVSVEGNIFVATTDGVFQSSNDGGSWHSVNTGFDLLNVQSLAVVGKNIYAGIKNSGVWVRPLSELGVTGVHTARPLNKELEIYPNPTAAKFTIHYSLGIQKVEIYSVLGKKIYEEKIPISQGEIDLIGYPSGVYTVKAISNGELITGKIIKN